MKQDSTRRHAKFSAEAHPKIAENLALLNEAALYDEDAREISYPRRHGPEDEETGAWRRRLSEAAEERPPEPAPLSYISFDIDLTLQIPEDEEQDTASLLCPEIITKLQETGHVVGTCSDREPSNQRRTMEQLGVRPQFCIPKEMLALAKELLLGESHLHIGDDPTRDRDIAQRAGWRHLWPAEAQQQLEDLLQPSSTIEQEA